MTKAQLSLMRMQEGQTIIHRVTRYHIAQAYSMEYDVAFKLCLSIQRYFDWAESYQLFSP